MPISDFSARVSLKFGLGVVEAEVEEAVEEPRHRPVVAVELLVDLNGP